MILKISNREKNNYCTMNHGTSIGLSRNELSELNQKSRDMLKIYLCRYMNRGAFSNATPKTHSERVDDEGNASNSATNQGHDYLEERKGN